MSLGALANGRMGAAETSLGDVEVPVGAERQPARMVFRPVAKTETTAVWCWAGRWRAEAWVPPATPRKPTSATASGAIKNRLILLPFHKGIVK